MPLVKEKIQKAQYQPDPEHSLLETALTGITNCFYFTVGLLKELLSSPAPEANPYADEKGQPREGYYEKFFQFELKRDKQKLSRFSVEKRSRIEAARESLYHRMQS